MYAYTVIFTLFNSLTKEMTNKISQLSFTDRVHKLQRVQTQAQKQVQTLVQTQVQTQVYIIFKRHKKKQKVLLNDI